MIIRSCRNLNISLTPYFGEVKAFLDKDELVEELKKYKREDILIVVGGVIPQQDYDFLYKAGATAIFGPGTVIAKAAQDILKVLTEQTSK